MHNFKRHTVTAALPYANGPVHIGHLAGVYIPSDIYVRYLRQKGADVLFICGSDEHGVPITIKARKEGVTPKHIIDKYHSLISNSFKKFGITFDIYSRTSNAIHHETSAEIFKTLYDKNAFIEKENDQYFDEEALQFLADRYITGTCPHCNYEKAFGDQCESCGTSLSPDELINPRSTLSGNIPVKRKTKHWYLPLNQYEDWLKKWIIEEHKTDWRSNVYGQCKSWIDNGLQPRAVTRDLDWGVKVPIENTEGKVLYVWFDAPIGYISATKEFTKDWEKYWKDKDTRLIHFIGKDNIVFHCIIFPAILHTEGSYILPDNIPANEFLNLEGEKISTSRNWAVWLHEYLEEFPGKEDVLRYVLTANAPETKDNDFTWRDFQTRNNSELLAIFGNFVNRTMVLTHKYFNGTIPEVNELTKTEENIIAEIEKFPARIANNLEVFKFREALVQLMNLARLGNKYLTDSEPWKINETNPQHVKTILNIALQICANLAILSKPFLPFTAEKIEKMMNLSPKNWEAAGNISLLMPGHQINQPHLLFEKIDDEAIQYQIEKLKQTQISNQQTMHIDSTPKPNITFEDFAKLDIRTGTITKAEKVAKTKKLLQLEIDTGIDKRTVVSGIAEWFSPGEIIGKKVSVVVNLEPKKLRGIESQGMILMAENPDGKLIFVAPDDTTAINGSTIK
ncbi:MAG: methionine--tRNA ligase [Bacteroidales bacterium]|nr:methionine--tRNA ligase [Bacteroidales bacterium]